MKKIKKHFVLALCSFLFSTAIVVAQTEVQCGTIVEGEFTEKDQDGAQNYQISLTPGDRLRVSGESVGDYLQFRIFINAPTSGLMGESHAARGGWKHNKPSANTSALSERGNYIIYIDSNGPGLYTLYIGCTLRDGTVINPGDALLNAKASEQQPTLPPVELPANFVGFSGLAPVDFADATKIPLPSGVSMAGAITPTGGEIMGFTLDASANDILDLSFTRISGNLNLGLVVLSVDNKVVFQASLVTSQTLNTRFTLPSAGTYTIGVFRVDLLPPDAPEATAFQVQGTLNP